LRLEEVSGEDWDRRVSAFRDAVHEQTHAYAAARWGGRHVRCFTAAEDGAVIGGALVVTIGLPMTRCGIATVKFGPLHRPAGREAKAGSTGRIAAELRAHFCEDLNYRLTIIPPAGEEGPVAELAAAGYRPERPLADRRRYLVDLSPPLEALRAGTKARWRRNLKHAEGQGLDVGEEPGRRGLEIFNGVFDSLAGRKQGVDRAGLKEMTDLMQAADPRLRPRIFLARRRHYPVAGAIVSTIGERATYLFGAQTEAGQQMCASYGLQMHIIGALRIEGRCRWYDLGGDNNVAGLIQFKTGLIGEHGRIVTIPAPMSASGGRLSDLLAAAGKAARNLVP
jgi:hypothetical protein